MSIARYRQVKASLQRTSATLAMMPFPTSAVTSSTVPRFHFRTVSLNPQHLDFSSSPSWEAVLLTHFFNSSPSHRILVNHIRISNSLSAMTTIGSPTLGESASVGKMDHVLDILESYQHPCIIIGRNAHRWMGSAGMCSSTCDMLVRDYQLQSMAADLIKTGRWERINEGPFPYSDTHPDSENDADVVLRKTTVEHDPDYVDFELNLLCLWSEATYRINVDDCPTIEVPDFYTLNHVLIEEDWHPAAQRTDGFWYGPCPHVNSKLQNIPEWLTPQPLFVKRHPRGKSPSKKTPIFVPTLPTYLDALIYHVIHYEESRRGLSSESSWQIENLTRYLYLELPHQHLPLLIELEESEFMEKFLRAYVRKPCFVYHNVPGLGFTATRIREWDPSSIPNHPSTISPGSPGKTQ